MKILAKYIHGSEDSIDVDTYYIVDKVPSFQESKEFCDSIKDENANLLSIDENGHVNACYKGTPDECNNSLYYTYNLHPQSEPLLITSLVERDIWLKAIRAIRIILSHLSRTQYRVRVKNALKSSMYKKIRFLNCIDFNDIDFSKIDKSPSGKDTLKVIAFQIGQTLGLINGHEYYTKSQVANAYKELKPFLYRQDGNLSELDTLLYQLLDAISYEVVYDGDTTVALHDFEHTYDLKTEKPIKTDIQK